MLRLFTGIGPTWGKRAPWLAPSVEWGCFALAAAGLLWFVRQSLARQALRISLSEGAAAGRERGDRHSADWARHGAGASRRRRLARSRSIPCYWAAIALMEEPSRLETQCRRGRPASTCGC